MLKQAVVVVAAVAGLSACATGRSGFTEAAVSETTGSPASSAATPATLTGDAATAALAATDAAATVDTSADYHIGPMDMLDVSVFQVPDLNASVQVSQSGQITLPLLGQVNAAGKTALQLQNDIAAALGGKYLQNPQVTVAVKEMLSQRVTVEGAIQKPGVYPTSGKVTLLQMIAMSGGLNDTADTRGIMILRTANGQREAAKFDYDAIRSGKSDDPVLLADDVVVVDNSGLKTAFQGLKSALPVFGFFRPYLP